MRRVGLVVLLIGLALTFGSCAVFPSQFGSDYAAINAGGVMGTAVGVMLMLAGLAFVVGGDKRE